MTLVYLFGSFRIFRISEKFKIQIFRTDRSTGSRLPVRCQSTVLGGQNQIQIYKSASSSSFLLPSPLLLLTSHLSSSIILFMAPKSRAPKRGRSSSSSNYNPALFISANAFSFFERSVDASIIHGRRVVFTGLPSPIRRILNHSGWEPFLEMEEFVYPELVRFFYANFLRSEEDDSFTSLIAGFQIRITPTLLNEMLLVPDEGVSIIPETEAVYPPGTSRVDFLKGLCRPNVQLEPLVRANLNKVWLMIHLIVCHNIIPKGGDVMHITDREQILLSHLYSREKVNLGFLILEQMAMIASTSASRSLGFGMVITRILVCLGFQFHQFQPLRRPKPLNQSTLVKSSAHTSRVPSASPFGQDHYRSLRRLIRDMGVALREEHRSSARTTLRCFQAALPDHPVISSLREEDFLQHSPCWLDEPLSDDEDAGGAGTSGVAAEESDWEDEDSE